MKTLCWGEDSVGYPNGTRSKNEAAVEAGTLAGRPPTAVQGLLGRFGEMSRISSSLKPRQKPPLPCPCCPGLSL